MSGILEKSTSVNTKKEQPLKKIVRDFTLRYV